MTHPLVEGLKERLMAEEPSFDEDLRTQEQLEKIKKELDYRDNMTPRQIAYEDFLASPEWARLRNMRLQIDGYVCHGCGVGNATEVHHIWYPKEEHWKDTPLWCLVSLCRDCHKDAHRIFDRGVPWISR